MVNIVMQATLHPPAPERKRLRIAVLAYPGCMGMQVFGMAELLRLALDLTKARKPEARPLLDVHIVGLRGRSVAIAGGTIISTRAPRGRYDALIVPGMEIDHRVDWSRALAPLQPECAFVRRTYAAGTPVASVCVGAFVLGEAGLLQGRRATTAWLFAQALQQRYPTTAVDASAVLLDEAGVMTTGAISTAFDLAIHLIKHTLGADIATATARVALLPSERASQAPYVDTRLMLPQRLPSFTQQVTLWLQARLAAPFSLAALAAAFCVSPSTLLRRVKSENGRTPLALLQEIRVEKAKQLLHSTHHSLAQITEAVGYTDVASFSRLFVRLVGETPAHYRKRQSASLH
jgi:transcriptional regulator GlxA family with amidase domain